MFSFFLLVLPIIYSVYSAWWHFIFLSLYSNYYGAHTKYKCVFLFFYSSYICAVWCFFFACLWMFFFSLLNFVCWFYSCVCLYQWDNIDLVRAICEDKNCLIMILLQHKNDFSFFFHFMFLNIIEIHSRKKNTLYKMIGCYNNKNYQQNY